MKMTKGREHKKPQVLESKVLRVSLSIARRVSGSGGINMIAISTI